MRVIFMSAFCVFNVPSAGVSSIAGVFGVACVPSIGSIGVYSVITNALQH